MQIGDSSISVNLAFGANQGRGSAPAGLRNQCVTNETIILLGPYQRNTTPTTPYPIYWLHWFQHSSSYCFC